MCPDFNGGGLDGSHDGGGGGDGVYVGYWIAASCCVIIHYKLSRPQSSCQSGHNVHVM